MKLPKISTILHRAADHHLKGTQDNYKRSRYSCCAIIDAIDYYYDYHDHYAASSMRIRIYEGLKEMGCDVRSSHLFMQYGDNTPGVNETVQGMRYMWLKWAALMAEEQGV